MKQDLELKTSEAWNAALHSWHNPSIPQLIAVRTDEADEVYTK